MPGTMCLYKAVRSLNLRAESAGQSLPGILRQTSMTYVEVPGGGKSGLHRAERQVTPGRREPTESATESRPPTPA